MRFQIVAEVFAGGEPDGSVDFCGRVHGGLDGRRIWRDAVAFGAEVLDVEARIVVFLRDGLFLRDGIGGEAGGAEHGHGGQKITF